MTDDGGQRSELGIGNSELKKLKTHMNNRGPVFVTPRRDYAAAGRGQRSELGMRKPEGGRQMAGSTFAAEAHETVYHAEARAGAPVYILI